MMIMQMIFGLFLLLFTGRLCLSDVPQVAFMPPMQEPEFYLRKAGMNTDRRFKEETISLCNVYVRREGDLFSGSSSDDCSGETNDGILQTFVRENSQWNCQWVINPTRTPSPGSHFIGLAYLLKNLAFIKQINDKYTQAIQLATNDFNTYAVNKLKEQQEIHINYIKSNRHSSSLSATASNKAWWGPGGKCDLTLMAKVIILDV